MRSVQARARFVALLLFAPACKGGHAQDKPSTQQHVAALEAQADRPPLPFHAPCAAPTAAVSTGRATDAALSELSGVAASRRLPDVLWVHNDSGNKARVYAIAPNGRRLASWKLKKVPSTDWEDIAIGACGTQGEAKSASCIYLADTGDNRNDLKELHILRWPEPNALPAPGEDDTLKVRGDVEVFAFALPNGPDDCEAMVVLPDTRVVLFSKRNDATSNVYRVTLGDKPLVEALGTLSLRDELADHGEPLRVTAADLHPNGKTLALRTYGRVLVAELGDLLAGPVAAARAGLTHVEWHKWPQPDEPHGEAIGWAQDGGLWLMSDMQLPVIWHVRCP